MTEHLIEVSEYDAAGYSPVVDFQTWRVAMLNYIDELEPDRLDNVQCHQETDEVFVLLQGRCILFLAEVDDERRILQIHARDMQPNKVYNIKRGVYHTHTLSQDAKVLIVENRDTGDHNSPKIMLADDQRRYLGQLTAQLW